MSLRVKIAQKYDNNLIIVKFVTVYLDDKYHLVFNHLLNIYVTG